MEIRAIDRMSNDQASIFGLLKQYLQYGFFQVLVIQKMRGVSSIKKLILGFFGLSISMSFATAVAIGQREFMAAVIVSHVVASALCALVAGKPSVKMLMGWGLLPDYGFGRLSNQMSPQFQAQDLTYLKPIFGNLQRLTDDKCFSTYSIFNLLTRKS